MTLTPAKIYIALVRRLHFLVLLALMVPCYCLIVTYGLPAGEAETARSHLLPLYALTLTLAFPAAFTYLLQKKVKNIGTFLLCACPVMVLFLAGLCYLEMHLSLSILGGEQLPQALILVLYLFDAIRMRTNDNSRKKAKMQEDHSWMGDLYLLPLPALRLLIPFAAVYFAALIFHSNELAQAALSGAIVYFFLILPYHVLFQREAFLDGRHHISRIPFRRISRLQMAALVRVLLPCALLAAAALMTSGGRHFIDLPEIHLEYENTDPYGGYYEENYILRELMRLGLLESGKPVPQWLVRLFDLLENILTVFMTAVLAYAVWIIIRSLILRFRLLSEDDAPSPLTGKSQDEHTSLRPRRTRGRIRPGRNSVRRRYRRTILHYRRTPPMPYETPAMIEQRANLPDTPQMRKLHDAYEQERYAGPESTQHGNR